ncbi:hypothetical protein [Pseudomonas gingeri]|uniref:Uncharacterized protein n=1 Tax=Pseudomonas gingeri TaxID=117681 RepID=A0A7Y7YBI0_9PSED|nr:hypothetical protein [Pseudomonas gingeri]NWB25521.1 hypothetical protein [Pseudomonas gingeri]NWC33235.1 hypothetical protein [Pseudomonas gingeri]
MTEHAFGLSVAQPQRSAALRERMNEAGCVFEFVVSEVGPGVSPDESLHRQALRLLHEQIMTVAMAWHQQLIRQPQHRDRAIPIVTWDLDQAKAVQLEKRWVRSLVRGGSVEEEGRGLYQAFCDPPYGTRFSGGEEHAQALFQEWMDLLGFCEQDDIVVLNWVDGCLADLQASVDSPAGRVPWSDYFDAGLEWWGIWCLTVWSPERRTVSALVASATD